MSYDGKETAYTLFACNLHKERGSMRIVAVAGNMETLYAAIGNEIIEGNMDYRGYSKLKGFGLFREDYKKDEFSSANLDYGYIEDQPILLLENEAADADLKQTYGWLTMDDSEYNRLRDGSALKGVAPDRLRLILDRALRSAANDYRGAELYDFLHGTLDMKDDEISKVGFDMKEFYAVPDEYVNGWENEAAEEPDDEI
ncbi:MAG: hypothetical protein DBY36_02230 [Clostridiales bacterium]|nr:MAG: hypothetical protein DBY36_02230 [Clostridiales bacterium]